ncbi:MAG: protein kinase [Candidatus Melainabacteria bacterium]|nr:protein kinase [Candidatus Melainabacteria bacterium]
MTGPANPQPEQDAADFSTGSVVFERFKILGEIASGAKGRVYKAQDTILDNTVALKVLITDHKTDRDLVRFQSEARLASKMNHPGIATIFDFGVYGNTPFLSMEFVEGESLDDYLKRHHTISVLEFCEIYLQVCASIDHAHAAGIVHRDIKPANIVISRNDDGSVKATVLDFGVAKNLDIVEEDGGKLTPTGNLIGSPNYMSPEQSRGSTTLTAKSDNYSLGCVMWVCLVGEPPFQSDSVMAVLSMHAHTEPPPILELVELPPKLASLIDGLLSKNPVDRPDLKTAVIPTLQELLEEFSLSLRTEEDDTTGGADEQSTWWDYLRPRMFYISSAATLLFVVLGTVLTFKDKTAASGDLAGVHGGKTPAHLGQQTEYIGSKEIDRLLQEVRRGRTDRISMSFSYDEANLKKCAGLTNLKKLDLSDTPFSDEQTKHLIEIPNLHSLMLNRTQIATLANFDKLKNVVHLELKNTRITDNSLRNLLKMKSLTRLFAANNDITDDGVHHLSALKNLDELDLTSTKITPASARFFETMPNLRILNLNKTKIDETGLRKILAMPKLQLIMIEDCSLINAELVETLRRDFPTLSFDNRKPLLSKRGEECKKALERGDIKTAYSKAHEIIGLAEKRFSTDSREIAALHITLAIVCAKYGKFDEADRAIAKIQHYTNRHHDQTMEIAVLECQLLRANQDKNGNAIALSEKIVEKQEQISGRNSNEAASRIIQLGGAYQHLNQPKKAIRAYQSAAARLKLVKSPNPDLLSICQCQIGECLRMIGKHADAAVLYKKLIAELEREPVLSDSRLLTLFSSYAGLGATKFHEKNYLGALECTDKMRSLLKSGKIASTHEASLYRQRGVIFHAMGREEESKSAFAQYNKIEQELSKNTP